MNPSDEREPAIYGQATVIVIDDDPGTMFEIGFAHSLGIPVYAYREGLRDGDSINLMIAQSVRAVFSSSDDLARYLETGEHKDADYAQF